ncbi:MAG TPA: DUF72 domain-containing protein [Cyclobacteriaceae bacterium]
MKYQIGCSGYYYPQWKDKFYPSGLQPKNWLEHYSSIFNSVELNGTFYRTPTVTSLQKHVDLTPEDFTFSVKMNRSITHIQRLKEKGSIHDFQELILNGLGKKLSHFLFQMPPSFHFNEQNLKRVTDHIPHTSQNVIEFRHVSWWNQETEQALKDAHLIFCNVDFPGLKTHFIHTKDFYLRLHGNPELFISSYTTEQLKAFYQQIPEECKSCSVYFNNTMYEAGYKNALEFMEIANVPA